MFPFRRKPHPIVKDIMKVLLEKKFEGTWVNQVYGEAYCLVVNLRLPEHKERADLEKILQNLQQQVSATAVKINKTDGKNIELRFGMRELDDVDFDESMLRENTLQLFFPSAYGETILDFEDGASCHLLNGGATRMGKTCFILYLALCIFMQNKGNVGLYISSAKLKDYYPFEDIPQVQMERDIGGMISMLDDIVIEYKRRDELLYSPSLRKATDAKSVRELYPEHYHEFKPIFLIIDEYARFAESNRIQELVTELVETAGFVNIHVVIASQRPDAKTVLKPRIRANLLTRMSFTTVDRKNSEIILDTEGAEKLGKIAGRALLSDGEMDVVHVPYINAVQCDKLLEGYKREQKQEGCVGEPTIDEIQSNEQESDGLSDLLNEFKPNKRGEQSLAEDVFGWEDSTGTKGEG